MTEHSSRMRIKGNSTRMIVWAILPTVLYCFAMSFVIMGTAFFHFFLALLVLALPFVIVGIVVVHVINWFEFDDEKRNIVRALWRSFSYDTVKSIRIKERWGRSSISIRSGWLRKRWLVDGLNRDEAARVEQELAHRVPRAVVHRKKYSNRMMAAVICAILLSMVAASAGFVYYSSAREPRLFMMPENKDWLFAGQPKTGVHYSIDGIGFMLPRRFKLLQNSGAWRYFEDEKQETKLSAGTGIYHEIFGNYKSIVRFLTGLEDSYDLFRLVYAERFGTLPTAMKIISFNRKREIKLYELERDSLKGFVLQGKKLGEAFAEIVVTDKTSGKEIYLFIQQPGSLKEDMLQSLVGSIKPEV